MRTTRPSKRLFAYDQPDRRSRLGRGGIDIPHRHRAANRRREAAAGDDADVGAALVLDAAAGARRRLSVQTNADALSSRPLQQLSQDDLVARKAAQFASASIDRPAQAGLDRRRRFVDIVAPQAKPGL